MIKLNFHDVIACNISVVYIMNIIYTDYKPLIHKGRGVFYIIDGNVCSYYDPTCYTHTLYSNFQLSFYNFNIISYLYTHFSFYPLSSPNPPYFLSFPLSTSFESILLSQQFPNCPLTLFHLPILPLSHSNPCHIYLFRVITSHLISILLSNSTKSSTNPLISSILLLSHIKIIYS